MCVIQDEVAGGACVRECVLRGFMGVVSDVFNLVVVVVVVEEGKTINMIKSWVGGQLECSITIIS